MNSDSEIRDQTNGSNEIVFGSNLSESSNSGGHIWVLQTLVILIMLSIVCGQAYKKMSEKMRPAVSPEAVPLAVPVMPNSVQTRSVIQTENSTLESEETLELLGMKLNEVPDYVSHYFNLPSGLEIREISAYSAASSIGFRKNDIIITVNDKPAGEYLPYELYTVSSGTAVVFREGKYYSVTFP